VSVDQNVEKYVRSSNKKEGEGRGGMASKLKIAKGTANKDIPTYIANGKGRNVIVDIIKEKNRHKVYQCLNKPLKQERHEIITYRFKKIAF
jgi:glutamate 5-kinase